MSLSDCEKCWQTPCVCGHSYRNYNQTDKVELIQAILKDCSPKEVERICKKLFNTNIDDFGNVIITLKND